jgi:hypothetical protein
MGKQTNKQTHFIVLCFPLEEKKYCNPNLNIKGKERNLGQLMTEM